MLVMSQLSPCLSLGEDMLMTLSRLMIAMTFILIRAKIICLLTNPIML